MFSGATAPCLKKAGQIIISSAILNLCFAGLQQLDLIIEIPQLFAVAIIAYNADTFAALNNLYSSVRTVVAVC